MNTMQRRESARIYQFPQKPRTGVATREVGQMASVARLPRPLDMDFGSAWYHEAAIQEDRARRP